MNFNSYSCDFVSADEDITVNEPIEPDTPSSEIRPEPYTLPQGFVWDTLALDNPQTVRKKKHNKV